MLDLSLRILLAYLIGTLLGSLILGKLRGVDIRKSGSGNAGATNALRTQGKAFAAAVLLLDVAKGSLAVTVIPSLALALGPPSTAVSPEWQVLACGLAVIVGHVYPVWFGFRGGKGVATVVGVMGAIGTWLLLPLFGCWIMVVMLTGYVGLASMLAGVGLCIAVRVWKPDDLPLFWFCLTVTAFIVFTHRANIARMAAGTENRARRLWLFRPRAV